MAIEKMRLLRMAGSKENIEKILLTAFATNDLHAELASHVVNEGNGGKLIPEDNTFAEYLKRIDSMARSLNTEIMCAFDGVTKFTHDQIEMHLLDAEAKFEKINEQLMMQSNLTDEDKEAIQILRTYDITALNDLKYTFVTFGRLPLSSIPKIMLHEEKSFILHSMTKNNQYAWVLVVALLDKQKEVNNILESLYFEPIAIPKIDEEQFTIDCESTLGQIYGYVRHYAELAKYYKYMAVFDDEVVITGFVPKRVCKAYKTLFGDLTDVVIQDFPAESEEGLEPPTVLRNNWFAKPFELFIEMYGLPHYGDFDPTFYVAITYSLLFGIMFGDLGQGLVLVIGGFALWKWKKMTLAAVAMRIGLFSMFFGTMFGSFFGDEEILTPFFTDVLGLAEKPFHVMDPGFTMTLLLSAVGLGATLILVSIFLNIISRIKKKDWAAAFFSQNGLAGFIFYGSAIGMATSEMLLQIPVANQLTIGAFIIVPLLIILMHVPLKNLVHKVSITPHEGWGGYLVESIFELLEIVLSFVTNTMSFLRVGGFVLSHAGMMVVVMTLKEMTGNAGLLVLIIGNIFVIALEGLIVGIQTLRLQYYEMFSRYFEGGGKKYIPTTLLNQ